MSYQLPSWVQESHQPGIHTYTAQNFNELQHYFYLSLDKHGVLEPSRNGPVKRLPGVTVFRILRPMECVNFSPTRNANPFFHLVEAAAMLTSTNSVALLSAFAKNMRSFSDDGQRYNAFYGERLRATWGDQLTAIIDELRKDRHSRQCVAQIWSAAHDLGASTKDKACNTQLMFSVNDNGELCMTSTNRSNDAIWGIVSGANCVHFPFFQAYVAAACGLAIGPWTHVSNNVHVYTRNPQWPALLAAANRNERPFARYALEGVPTADQPLIDGPGGLFAQDLMPRWSGSGSTAGDHKHWTSMVGDALFRISRTILEPRYDYDPSSPFKDVPQSSYFVNELLVPMCSAWKERKVDNWTSGIDPSDWYVASRWWLTERAAKETT